MSVATLVRTVFWTMVISLSGAQAATLAMGFGAPIPTMPVIAGYVVGTVLMIGLFTAIIITQIRGLRSPAAR